MENDDPTLFDLDALEDDEIDKAYRPWRSGLSSAQHSPASFVPQDPW